MKKLIIVDISNIIYRSFYGIDPLHAPDGTPTNAVYGVLTTLIKILDIYKPTHLFIAKDSVRKAQFRVDLYPEYKANRKPTPEGLSPQFKLINELIEKLGISNLSATGYEADDVIGSAITQWKNEFDEIYIATSDKDLMQLVDDKVKILDTGKDRILGRQEVFEKMGVYPEQIVDYLAIVGDSSDNIPGMKGIGAKGAADLLNLYGSLDQCIANKDTYTKKRLKNAFDNHVEDAILSKRLATIATDIDLGKSLDEAAYSLTATQDLMMFLKGLGFDSTIDKIFELDFY